MVLNNRDLNQVTWEERVQLGDGKTELTQSIPDFPYHKYAELIGLKGIFCNDPDKIGAAWEEALAADRPVILDMYTDPKRAAAAAAHHAEGREELHDDDGGRAGARQRAQELGQAGALPVSCRKRADASRRSRPCDRVKRSVEPGSASCSDGHCKAAAADHPVIQCAAADRADAGEADNGHAPRGASTVRPG